MSGITHVITKQGVWSCSTEVIEELKKYGTDVVQEVFDVLNEEPTHPDFGKEVAECATKWVKGLLKNE
jgi:hypothetical protein